MTRVTVATAVALVLAAGSALAHHDPFVYGTVRITQAVVVGETTLQPGTYEIRDTGRHLDPLPGQSPTAISEVEFVADGQVVARGAAEILEAEPGAVGTSDRNTQPVVHLLKGGDFLRVSAYHNGERYLIHLQVAK